VQFPFVACTLLQASQPWSHWRSHADGIPSSSLARPVRLPSPEPGAKWAFLHKVLCHRYFVTVFGDRQRRVTHKPYPWKKPRVALGCCLAVSVGC
jgi:hypothetical protein